jgi:hypothetical protein
MAGYREPSVTRAGQGVPREAQAAGSGPDHFQTSRSQYGQVDLSRAGDMYTQQTIAGAKQNELIPSIFYRRNGEHPV